MGFCSWGHLTKVAKELRGAYWPGTWYPYLQTQTKKFWNILQRTRNGSSTSRHYSYRSATNSRRYICMRHILRPSLVVVAPFLYVPRKSWFLESISDPTLTISFQVVPKHSACIPGAMDAAKIAISSDHTNMVKFGSAEDDGFRKVSDELCIMMKSALQKIEENWAQWGESASVKQSGW